MAIEQMVWDTAKASVTLKLTGHQGKVHALAYLPELQLLASGSADKTIVRSPSKALQNKDTLHI